jgi:hypothetical protein
MTIMTTQRYEIEAWLGDDHGLTDDQITDLMQASDDIEARYLTVNPDSDDPEQEREDQLQATQEERDAALLAAYKLITDEQATVVRELRAKRLTARREETEALAALRQAAVTLVDPQAGKGARGLSTYAGFAAASGVHVSVVRGWVADSR